jgi:phage shock protein A
MNERIKELAEQATLAVTKPDGHYIVQAWQEKFAELLVRECANICDAKRAEYTKLSKDADSFKDKNLWAEGEISAHRIRISIQEHFGVE